MIHVKGATLVPESHTTNNERHAVGRGVGSVCVIVTAQCLTIKRTALGPTWFAYLQEFSVTHWVGADV